MTAWCHLPESNETQTHRRIIRRDTYSDEKRSNHNHLQVTPVAAHQVRKVEPAALEPDACMSRGHGPYLKRNRRAAMRERWRAINEGQGNTIATTVMSKSQEYSCDVQSLTDGCTLCRKKRRQR